jgi:biotin operon repressor
MTCAAPASLFRQDADALLAVFVSRMAARHSGRRRGVSAAALAGALQISERMLRRLVTRAREEGVAIVGTPETGYFVAQSATELNECCGFLRSRAMHSLAIEARLRKVALAELLGQLRVGT